MTKCYGIQGDAELHHIDHVGLICHIMDAPILFTDEDNFKLAQKYYPQFKKEIVEWRDLAPDRLVHRGDVIFYTNFFGRESSMPKLRELRHNLGKTIRSVCCPHGNSDKGHSSVFMEHFEQEDIVLVYGQRMINFLYEKNVRSPTLITVGNYRLSYYLKERVFFDELAKIEILSHFSNPFKPLVLYAPTWEDWENGTSFFAATEQLIAQLPKQYNLVVKCHPRLLQTSLTKVWQLQDIISKREDVVILTDYPHVYPLLALADFYIGDMSSIGYDFLYFDRPLFFLNHKGWDFKANNGLKLFKAGVVIEPADFERIFDQINIEISKPDAYRGARQTLYQETFGPPIDLNTLKQRIQNAYEVDCFSKI
ncbi:MAG: CDP-glycerol glycerophosphotransferase family protein [Parachlamydiales bacterium]|nr:CDP-glycerol glycerophosphotransferase family protein [Parachlamydiales bacterium]